MYTYTHPHLLLHKFMSEPEGTEGRHVQRSDPAEQISNEYAVYMMNLKSLFIRTAVQSYNTGLIHNQMQKRKEIIK